MDITAIGVSAFIIGIICTLIAPKWGLCLMMVLNLLGAASALSIGSASIAPGHMILLLFAFSLVLAGRLDRRMVRYMISVGPGLWLLLFVFYSDVSGYFFPRLLSGLTQVNAIGSTELEPSLVPSPLVPSSGNISQGIYVTFSALSFFAIYTFCHNDYNIRWALKSLLICSFANSIFAIIDLVTYFTNTSWLLDFIRNGPYSMHTEESMGGLKRIAGSFSETSVFSAVTLSYLAFTTKLWRAGIYTRITAPLTIIQMLLLLFSTSSTAYVGLAILILYLLLTVVLDFFKRKFEERDLITLVVLPLIVSLGTIMVMSNQELTQTITDVATATLFDKSSSESGMERQSWNFQAYTNFLDTYGLGTGIGGARASSFLLAIISNVGVVGTIFYVLFVVASFFPLGRQIPKTDSSIQEAVRIAAFMIFIAASISGTMVDLGLSFFIFAGISASLIQRQSLAGSGANNFSVK